MTLDNEINEWPPPKLFQLLLLPLAPLCVFVPPYPHCPRWACCSLSLLYSKDWYVSSLLHCCCHCKDWSFSSSSSLLPAPPLALLHVFHPHPLVVLSAARSPCVAHLHIASQHSPPTRLALSPTPPLLLHCPLPACLTLSIATPPHIIQHLLAPQIIYLDLMFAFIIPLESFTSLFFRTQQIVNVVVHTMSIASMWTRQSLTPPTNLFTNMLGTVPVNSLQWFTCFEDISCEKW